MELRRQMDQMMGGLNDTAAPTVAPPVPEPMLQPQAPDRDAQINDLYDNWQNHFKEFYGYNVGDGQYDKKNYPVRLTRPNHPPEKFVEEYKKIYGSDPRSEEQAATGVYLFYNTMRHNMRNKRPEEDINVKEMASVKQLFGTAEEAKFKGNEGQNYPDERDVHFAKRKEAFYDLDYEPFITPGLAKASQPSFEEMPQTNREFYKDIKKIKEQTRKPVQGDTADLIAETALANRRSSTAALGFDPREMVFTEGTYGGTAGANIQKGVGKNSTTEGIFASKSKGVPMHESIHKGIQNLRNSGKLPTAIWRDDINLDSGLDGEMEEMVVRRIVQRFMGDVEKEQRPDKYTKKLEDKGLVKKLDAFIDQLEGSAANEIKKKKPGGPR